MAELDIRLLGPVRLLVNGRAVPVGGPKPQTLLAVLTVNRRVGVSSRVLIDALWDGDPPGNPQASVHGYVCELRRELRAAAGDDTALRTLPGSCYELLISDDQCDVGRFEAARTAGLAAAARGDHAAAAESFGIALTQWSGEPVAGLHVGFSGRFATDMAERRLGVELARADAETACGRADSVITTLTALTGVYRLHEGLWQRLMRALYAAGRRGEALDAYHRVRRNLCAELGLDPDPETDALRDAILRRGPAPPPRAAPGRTATAGPDTAPVATLRLDDGRTIEVPTRGLRIGRGADNDLVLSDIRVSRTHARVVVRRAGVVIHDLGSANGIYVNGVQILSSTVLSDGDIIGVGSTELRYEGTGRFC
ncbi:BTAD domain-containing putative transcriptional regulator [Nocardia sp. NPDC127526]|uniref:BTAD domain-containing putative transcriptional regulator n=1 Tax=Nocardia sp. NPDC127526 TaxID=3345393 RepID=UPI0036398D4C